MEDNDWLDSLKGIGTGILLGLCSWVVIGVAIWIW